MSYLKDKYNKEIKSALQKELGVKSVMSVPTIKKVVVNVGAGEAINDKTIIDTVVSEIMGITGQRPVVTKAKLAVSTFKIRQGDPIGVKVTLRGEKMWNFTEKMIDLVFPRIKDFRGLNPKAFDQAGNYTVGLEEQTVFFEIDPNKVAKLRGMEITFVTAAGNKEAGYKLLKALGFPFRELSKKAEKETEEIAEAQAEAEAVADEKAEKSANLNE
jgi:large subunit ribosomal protein L5